MDEVTRACLCSLSRVLEGRAIPQKDLPLVAEWIALPNFSLTRFRALVEEQQRAGKRISSIRFFDARIREAFVSRATERVRPRLLSERSWEEYLAHYTRMYGAHDEQQTEWMRYRWEQERHLLGLPKEHDEEPYSVPPIHAGSTPDLGLEECAA